MTRKLKDPRRQMLADARAQRNQKRAAARADGHAEKLLAAETIGEMYRREVATGMTPAAVAKKYGVTRQTVHAMTDGHAAKTVRMRAIDAKRNAWRKRATCGVCGEEGHNSRRHTATERAALATEADARVVWDKRNR
jgi:hypothetical protein